MIPAIKFLDLIIVDSKKNIFDEYIIKEQNRKNKIMPIAYYLDNDNSDDGIDFDEFDDFNAFGLSIDISDKPKKQIKQIKQLNSSFFDDKIYELNDIISSKIDENDLKKISKKTIVKNKKEISKIKESLEDIFNSF